MGHMLYSHIERELPHTAAKVVATIGRLEELQCLNTAELVTMWAWTPGVFDPNVHNAWELIESSTRSFYRTHGIGRLKALEQHTTNEILYQPYIFETPMGASMSSGTGPTAGFIRLT